MCDHKLNARLARLLPRLGADNEREVLAAVGAIRRSLAREGRDFHDLAERLEATPEGGAGKAQRAPEARGSGADLEAMARALDLSARHRLAENQTDFIRRARQLLAAGHALSPAQARWLRDLYATKAEPEGAR